MKRFLLAAALGSAFAIVAPPSAQAGEAFGVGSGQWTFLSAETFQPSSAACEWSYFGSGYYRIDQAPGRTCTSVALRSPLELPEGARLTFYRVYFYAATGATLESQISKYYADNLAGGNPGFSNLVIGPPSSNAINGYSALQVNVPASPGIIFDSYDTSTPTARHQNYSVVLWIPSLTAEIRLKGVAVGYIRTIAPAPATASFADVPSTHPFFNEVAQLTKSGITQGCGNGNYCPDSPVTRGQMAAFLTRALGLHWDWSTDRAP